MAEYVLKEGEDHADVARRLLAESDDPNSVMWAPRPDTYGGGVYVVNNDETVAKVAADLQRARDEEAQRIADAQQAADKRDAKASETGMTPTQLGIPANTGTDPGAPGTEGGVPSERADLQPIDQAKRDAEANADADAEVKSDAETESDDTNQTPAQKRKAARQAKAEADQASADQAKSDTATEETK